MPSVSSFSDRILIVGDEAKSASAIERLLESAGYSADSVTSLESASQRIKVLEASLVIIELTASRVTGLSFSLRATTRATAFANSTGRKRP